MAAVEGIYAKSELNQFTFRFFEAYLKRQGESSSTNNILFSPLAIYTCISLLLEGASAEALTELQTFLSLPSSSTSTSTSDSPVYPDFLQELVGLLQSKKDQKKATFEIANSVWTNKHVQQSYLDAVTSRFPLPVEIKDDTEDRSSKVAAWIKKNTHGLIDGAGHFSGAPDDILLVNTVYFQGDWKFPFKAAKTVEDHPFRCEDGKQSKVELMCLDADTHKLKFYESDRLQAVTLPYHGSFEMTIILPAAKLGIAQFLESHFDLEEWQKIRQSQEERKGTIKLPRFKLHSPSQTLDPVLHDCGLNHVYKTGHLDAISPAAILSRVVHQAVLIVDEKGTTAAAAVTASLKRRRTVQVSPFLMVCDHPFLVFITDTVTHSISFFAKVGSL